MHRHRQFAASLTLAIVLGFAAGIVFVTVGRVVFADPSSSFGASLATVLSSYGFGLEAVWAPYVFLAALMLSLLGFWRLHWLAYVVSFTLLLILGVFSLNIFAVFSAYILGRSWRLFFTLHPDRFHGVPEWRQVLASGFLGYAVFGSAVSAYSPITRVATLRPQPPAPVVASQTFSPDQTKLDRAEDILIRVRSFSEVLQAAYQTKTIAAYPITHQAVPLISLRNQMPTSVDALIASLPETATVDYWSNGSGFALFANLPIGFTHPKKLAVDLLPETVLVRTDSDVTDDLDFDGLPDTAEARWHTSTVLADTDGDGYSDGVEVANGFSPTVPAERKN